MFGFSESRSESGSSLTPRRAIQRIGWSFAIASVGAATCLLTAGVSLAQAEECDRLLPDFRCDDREARPAGHVEPMSMPYLFEDPYITTSVNFVGIYHNFPSDSALDGGEAGVLAVQARLAITDRLAFIATKDGFMINRPDNPALENEEGFMNITAGFKYAVIDDRERGIIVTPAFRFEIPVGNDDVLQGNGDGVFIPSVTAGWGPENIHLITGLGFQLPIDGDENSSSMFYNIHLNQAFETDIIPGAQFIVPFIELNGLTYLDSGDGSTQINLDSSVGLGHSQPLKAVQNILHGAGMTATRRWDGADVANLGSSGMANEDLITMAWGVRVPFENGVSLGFSYERVLSQREDIFEQRATWMASYTF
jgi:hypothetical protein